MAEIKNPERYHIIAFNANFALSGGIVFARDNRADGDVYYVVSEFATSDINSRRYPYKGKIEDIEYLFTEEGLTATGMFTLFCVDGIIDSSESGSGGGGGDSSGSGDSSGVPGSLTFRETIAHHALNAMIQLTPNPLAYKTSTIRLLTQKAFEFADEFIGQSEKIRRDTGETGGEGDQLDKEAFEQFVKLFRNAMFTESGTGSTPVYDSVPAATEKTLHDALFTTIEESGSGGGVVSVEKSIFSVMKDAIVEAIHDSFTTDTAVGSTPVVQNMAELLKTQSDAIVALSNAIGDINTTIGLIQEAQDEIVEALTGSGGGSGIMSQINAINLGVQDVKAATGTWASGDATVLQRLSALKEYVDDLENSLGSRGQGDNALTILNALQTAIGNISFSTLETKVDTLTSRVGVPSGSDTIASLVASADANAYTVKERLGTPPTGWTIASLIGSDSSAVLPLLRALNDKIGVPANSRTIANILGVPSATNPNLTISNIMGLPGDAATENTVEGRLAWVKAKLNS